VENDPHFVVSVAGLKDAVCFDVDGRPGFVYQLLYDTISGTLLTYLLSVSISTFSNFQVLVYVGLEGDRHSTFG